MGPTDTKTGTLRSGDETMKFDKAKKQTGKIK